ncbi:hypothetical protein PIIN_06265 [Serendipita indica DSM 11827]|uniref:DUF6593 domain-containing protein n=1 Tax=Serendipita indica (strain DSM 11827) TaxID=1109443 RepID=G4TLY8_SERID|nr:hypothetical protein PIIN_06265 [Serendipita indica DSM 11827]
MSSTPISLVFESSSLYNNTISCDTRGIRYQISCSSDEVITIKRWDSKTGLMNPVYELKMPYFTKEKYRNYGEVDWRPMNQLLEKAYALSTARTFCGADGRNYRWEAVDERVVLLAVSDIIPRGYVTARYNWSLICGELSSLQILHEPVLETLDIIIRTSPM